MRKLLIAAAFAALAFSPLSYAQTFQTPPGTKVQTSDGVIITVDKTANQVLAGMASPMAVGVTTPGVPVVAVSAPPATDYSFSAGTQLASLVNWLYVVFGGLLTTFATKWLIKLANKAGIETNQALNGRLEEGLRNGLNQAAATAQVGLQGKLNVVVRDKVVAAGVDYVLKNQGDLIQQLGLDPKNGDVTKQLQAKAESVILSDHADLKTNPILDPSNVIPTPAKA